MVSGWKSRLSNFWLLQLFGWAAYGLMIYITFLPVLPSEASPARLFRVKLVRAAIGFLLTSALHYIYRRCRRSGLGFGSIAVVSVVCSALFGCLWVVCANLYLWTNDPASFHLEKSLAGAPREALDYASIVLAWSALYFGIKYWQDSQQERERTLEASALANQAQLDMLRYQLNPHFLFNALNSLRASIDEDPQRAKRMVTEFSEFLRYTLLNDASLQVTLREEVEAIRNYLAIEKIRFEDKLQVTFDIEPAAEEFPLPGFLIHPLVENAIKYGMHAGQTPLVIHLAARSGGSHSLQVEVANTGRWVEASAAADPDHSNGTGTGLRNIRRRLEQHFPGQSSFKIGERDGWIRACIEIDRTTVG